MNTLSRWRLSSRCTVGGSHVLCPQCPLRSLHKVQNNVSAPCWLLAERSFQGNSEHAQYQPPVGAVLEARPEVEGSSKALGPLISGASPHFIPERYQSDFGWPWLRILWAGDGGVVYKVSDGGFCIQWWRVCGVPCRLFRRSVVKSRVSDRDL